MLCTEWDKLGRDCKLKRHPFVPVNSECVHEFAVFTSFDAPLLEIENDEPVPVGQGVGQRMRYGADEDDDDLDEVWRREPAH